MKGFYALAAAIAAGSMISAMAFTPSATAFTPQPRPVEHLTLHQTLPQINESKLNSVHRQASMSRAADFDVLDCNHMIYWDMQDNGSDEEGIDPVDAMRSATLAYEKVGDNYLMYNFMGLNIEPLILTYDENGTLCLKLGTKVMEGTLTNGMPFYAVIGSFDFHKEYALDNFVVDGVVELEEYEGGYYFDAYTGICLFCFNKETDARLGFLEMAVGVELDYPNATLHYTNYYTPEEEIIITEVKRPIVYRYYEKAYKDEDGKEFDVFTVSNVNVDRIDMGYVVEFQVEDNIAVTLGDNVPAYPSSWNGDGYTGTFYMWGLVAEDEETLGDPTKYLYGMFNEDKTRFDFPINFDDSDENFVGWMVKTEDFPLPTGEMVAYNFGENGPAYITFTVEEDGVQAVSFDNANAPVEYYNLQGVKLTQPKAGQVVIKKQGVNASKIVVR